MNPLIPEKSLAQRRKGAEEKRMLNHGGHFSKDPHAEPAKDAEKYPLLIPVPSCLCVNFFFVFLCVLCALA